MPVVDPFGCCGCEIAGGEIAPGETLEMPWSGLVYSLSSIPVACVGDPYGVANLDHLKDPARWFRGSALPASEVTIVVRLYENGMNGSYENPTVPFDVIGTFDFGADAVFEIPVD